MAFKMNGSPAKMGTIQGTAGHSSALKMKAEADASALKQMELTADETKGMTRQGKNTGQDLTINATGTQITTKGGKEIKVDPKSKSHKAILDTRWKKGDKASGGTLNELVKQRKSLTKGTKEYAVTYISGYVQALRDKYGSLQSIKVVEVEERTQS